MRIFPAKIDFYGFLEKAINNAHKTTETLVALMEDFGKAEEYVKAIHDLEQTGDMITHDIIRNLNQTFLTPLDREDIHMLASRIDDVVDLVWACVDKMIVFRIDKPTKDVAYLSKELHTTTRAIQKAFKELEKKDYAHVKEYCIEINEMENKIDRIFRNALGDLFEDFKDQPIMIIKWKNIYEHLEDSADKCEDIANILEGIVLKHA